MKTRLLKVALLAAFAALVLATPALAAKPQFAAPVFYATGGGPRDVVEGDFDNDGNRDLATANFFNSGNDDVSLLLGNGDGTFDAAQNFDAVAGVQALAKGDFDADGNLDLAVADQGPTSGNASFAVLFGNGTSANTFDAPVVYDSGGINAIDILDKSNFDNDGDTDLAVVNVDSNNGVGNVVIFINDGSGVFAQGQTLQTGGDSPSAVDRADFDEDGDLDLVVTNSGSDRARVFFGDTGATFSSGPSLKVGDGPVHVISGTDYNGDGNADFVTANNNSDDITFIRGNGDGTFQARLTYPSGGEGPFHLTRDDFNRNGRLDIAVANQFTRTGGGPGNNKGNVGVLQGTESGGFGNTRIFDTGDGPTSVTSGRFDGDNFPDLATANFGAGGPAAETDTVSVLLNTTTP